MKQTFALSEKASNNKIYKAAMEPSFKKKLRERLLCLQGKLVRFKTQLHPSAEEFQESA